MNAKTTKFLAVFAVLVMAFAAVAIFAPEENDAAANTSAWTNTVEKTSISLGSDIITVTEDMAIECGKYYYVAADATLTFDKAADASNGVPLIFLKDGADLEVIVPEHTKQIDYALYGVTESIDGENTILTLNKVYTDEGLGPWYKDGGLSHPNSYVEMQGYGEAWYGSETSASQKHYLNAPSYDGESMMIWTSNTLSQMNVTGGEGATAGEFYAIKNCLYDASYEVPAESTRYFLDATGDIIGFDGTPDEGGVNVMRLTGFTGILTFYKDEAAVEITDWQSGEITITKGDSILKKEVEIPEGKKIAYAQGATIPANFTFTFQRNPGCYTAEDLEEGPYYPTVDVYTFTNQTPIVASVGGFEVAAGANGFELSGKVDAGYVGWSFKGAAFFTGSIDSTSEVFLTPDKNYDFTFGSATIYTVPGDDGGLVIAQGAVAVKSGAVLTVNEELDIGPNASLKVGEDAYVRVYGVMDIRGAAAGPHADVYTAGNIVADTVKYNGSAVTAVTDLAGVVYSYKDGSLTGTNVKFTKVDAARMAYVDLIGSGDLGINGVTVISNSSTDTVGAGYYQYSGIVFYPVATQDVLNLAAESRIVGGIRAIADITDQDVNPALWYAKYKINYETATPIFFIEYKETYEVTLIGVNTDYIITDSNGTPVYTYADGDYTKAKLIYGETYSLNGKVNTSKYTYTSNLNLGIDKKEDYIQSFDYVSTFLTKFTQVRSAQVIEVAVGEEQTITVTLTQPSNDPAFEVGEKILEFSTDDGVSTTDVFLETKDNKLVGIFKVFNTDSVLVKFVDKKFFYYEYEIDDDGSVEVDLTEDQSKAGWTLAFTGVEDATEGAITVDYELDVMDDEYQLVIVSPLTSSGSLALTITFEDYYKGSSGHKAEYTISPNTNNQFIIPNNAHTFVGETYSMTWTDLSEVREKMAYQGETSKPYVEGSIVSVGEVSTTYTLTLTKIYYASVQNSTERDFTVFDGETTTPVAKGETASKAVEIVKATVNPDDGDPYTVSTATLTLEVTGCYIRSWTYAIYANSTDTTPLYEGDTYSLPTADISVKGDIEGKVIRITNLEVIPILYLVKTQPDEHAKIAGDYSRAGYYGDKMFVYVNVEAGFSVTGVEVYYEDPEHEGFPGDKYFDAKKDSSPDQGDFWYYMMPASNVVLIPTTTSDYATVTFKNYDGTVLQGPTKVLKGTTPEYTGDIPTKPATETETYRFAGWEPVLAPVTEDTTYVAQFETVAPTSKDVSVTIGQKGQAINVVLYALDGAEIGAGTITIEVWYTYIDEEGDIMTESVEVSLTYDVEGKTAYVISDTTFIQELGENYGGAFAVTGTYTLGAAQGDIIRTAYTPVEA